MRSFSRINVERFFFIVLSERLLIPKIAPKHTVHDVPYMYEYQPLHILKSSLDKICIPLESLKIVLNVIAKREQLHQKYQIMFWQHSMHTD